jgi:hypothetical protein
MGINYVYFALDDFTDISVGSGRGAWRHWGLMDHEGPIISLNELGYHSECRRYLPVSLLITLYERFKIAHPAGVKLGESNESWSTAEMLYGSEIVGRMYDERKMLISINVENFYEQYKYLTPYLPELLDPLIIERLANDPWLDPSLLGKAEALGAENGGISPNLWVDRAARWSPEWREYCDHLMKRNKNYKSFE